VTVGFQVSDGILQRNHSLDGVGPGRMTGAPSVRFGPSIRVS
jgi:hypothetical protein